MKTIALGQRIQLHIKTASGEIHLGSVVNDQQGDTISIMPPLRDGHYRRLNKLDDLRLTVHSEQGVLEWPAVFVGTRREKGVILSILKVTGKPKKVQRRDYCRLKVSFNAGISLLAENPPSTRTVKVMDISAGGLRMASKEKLPESARLNLSFSLPEQFSETIECQGTVVWSSDDEASNTCCYGVRFDEISESHADIIYKYIFRKQVEIRKTQKENEAG